MKITHIEEGNMHKYQKMVQTGDFELCDYGRGFLSVEIIVTPHYVNGEVGFDDDYQVRLYFSNIDDGDAGAWSKPMPFEKAKALAKKVANKIFKDMNVLPSMVELNKLVKKYGLYITFE